MSTSHISRSDFAHSLYLSLLRGNSIATLTPWFFAIPKIFFTILLQLLKATIICIIIAALYTCTLVTTH